MKPLRLIAALAASLLFTQPAAAADKYPSKPVRVIVPYQAGQGTDVAGRYLAEYLAKSLGQAFIVENRPGAGGNIGTSEVARAAPDGYTLLMGTNGTHVLNQYMYASTAFDPEKDFEPIMLVSSFPMVLLSPARIALRQLAGPARRCQGEVRQRQRRHAQHHRAAGLRTAQAARRR